MVPAASGSRCADLGKGTWLSQTAPAAGSTSQLRHCCACSSMHIYYPRFSMLWPGNASLCSNLHGDAPTLLHSGRDLGRNASGQQSSWKGDLDHISLFKGIGGLANLGIHMSQHLVHLHLMTHKACDKLGSRMAIAATVVKPDMRSIDASSLLNSTSSHVARAKGCASAGSLSYLQEAWLPLDHRFLAHSTQPADVQPGTRAYHCTVHHSDLTAAAAAIIEHSCCCKLPHLDQALNNSHSCAGATGLVMPELAPTNALGMLHSIQALMRQLQTMPSIREVVQRSRLGARTSRYFQRECPTAEEKALFYDTLVEAWNTHGGQGILETLDVFLPDDNPATE